MKDIQLMNMLSLDAMHKMIMLRDLPSNIEIKNLINNAINVLEDITTSIQNEME